MTGAARPAAALLTAWLAILGLAGCSSDSSTAAPSPSASVAVPQTPDPTSGAARAYLAAATPAQGQVRALLATGCASFRDLADIRSCWAQRARIEHAFNTAVYAIPFPPAVQPDAHSLVVAAARLEAAMASLAVTPDPSRDPHDLNIYASASSEVLTEVVAVRRGLGLPPAAPDVPFF